MRPPPPKLLLVTTALANVASAVLVANGSPCDVQCGNTLSATTGADVLCTPSDASTQDGVVYENCIGCELTSGFVSDDGTQSDNEWLLYNTRYAVSWCLFGDLGNPDPVGSVEVCATSRACGDPDFQAAIEYANLSLSVGSYDYCANWSSTQAVKCEECLQASTDGPYLSNYITILDAACQQQPAANTTLYIAGSPFSSTPMVITTPTPNNPYLNMDTGPISLGGKVGIAIGGLAFLLTVIGFCIVCNGRRRRRAYLHKLEMRQKEAGWPHPGANRNGGVFGGIMPQRGEVNDTPLSQKPLRGWDDSPQSATMTDAMWGQYHSPYSSQYNSPVSAAESSSKFQQWPVHGHEQMPYPTGYGESSASASQQVLPTQAHDHTQSQYQYEQPQHLMDASSPQQAKGQEPMDIGLALGGSQPSLHTQPSDADIVDKENDSPDSYEMHHVVSAGGHRSSQSFSSRMQRQQAEAPVLQHPGYGRYSPTKMPPATYAGHGVE